MKLCSWCGKEATEEVQIRGPSFSGVGTNRRMIKPAFMVPVCDDHKDIVANQPKFYTCGCSYVRGEPRCFIHENKLQPKFREGKD